MRNRWCRAGSTRPVGLLVVIIILPIIYWISGERRAKLLPGSMGPWASIDVVLLVVFVACGCYFVSATTHAIRREANDGLEEARANRRRIEQWGGWLFVILHFVTAIMYFKYSFNAEGTVTWEYADYFG
jgi:uncharacterized membrane protein